MLFDLRYLKRRKVIIHLSNRLLPDKYLSIYLKVKACLLLGILTMAMELSSNVKSLLSVTFKLDLGSIFCYN